MLVVPVGFPDPKDPMIPFRVSGWCPWWGRVVLVVPEGFPDPKDPMIPFRVTGCCPCWGWVHLVVLKGFPDPKDPMVPFRVSCWCLWWWWMGLVVPEGFQALMVPRSHLGMWFLGPRGISEPDGATIPLWTWCGGWSGFLSKMMEF